MQIKEVKPGNFLLFRATTTIQELVNYLPVAQRLYEEAVSRNLRINGPIHWHYHNMFGDLSAPFTLEICLPVEEIPADYDGIYHVKRTEPFRCVSMIHEGGWNTIPSSYQKIGLFIGEKTLKPTGVNREIYINVSLQVPDANITEIQVGLN